MLQDLIAKTLAETYQDTALHWQVIIQESTLYIYVNYEIDYQLDRDRIIDIVRHSLSSLENSYEGFWLYTRVLGEVEPDWQTFIDLSANVTNEKRDSLIENTEELVSEAKTTIEEIKEDSSAILEDLESEVNEVIVESGEDPFVVEQITSESQVESISLIKESTQNNTVENTEPEVIIEPESIPESTIELTQYCFIRNKRLLSSELVAPRLNIANLIDSFHKLSNSDKQIVIPLLDNIFNFEEPLGIEHCSSVIQVWWQQITALNSEEKRKAAIWLSRYCFNPESTLDQVKAVFDAEAAKEAAQKADIENKDNPDNSLDTREEFKKVNRDLQSKTRKTQQANRQQKSKSNSNNINLLIPIMWLLGTILIIILGITSANSENLDRQPIPVICQETVDEESQEYCKLAVNFISEELLVQVQSESSEFNEYQEEDAIRNCEQVTNIRSGVPLADSSDVTVLDSYGINILPGIFVAEAEQIMTKESEDSTVRVACVYALKKHKTLSRPLVTLMSTDTIPHSWPAEAYKGKTSTRSLQSLNKALGVYSVFIVMGAGTLFTAIGLFVTSIFNLGITIYSMEALYQSAFILGLIEVIFANTNVPFIGGIFIILAGKTLALGITGACVKGLNVHWSDGYRTVALGTLTIFAIRSLLQYLLIIMILAFVN